MVHAVGGSGDTGVIDIVESNGCCAAEMDIEAHYHWAWKAAQGEESTSIHSRDEGKDQKVVITI